VNHQNKAIRNQSIDHQNQMLRIMKRPIADH